MTPKEKAEELIKKNLTAIAEESMDSDKIMLYSAKQCALILCDEILSLGYSRPFYEETKQEILNL